MALVLQQLDTETLAKLCDVITRRKVTAHDRQGLWLFSLLRIVFNSSVLGLPLFSGLDPVAQLLAWGAWVRLHPNGSRLQLVPN